MKMSAFIHGKKKPNEMCLLSEINKLFSPLSTTVGVESLSDQLTSLMRGCCFVFPQLAAYRWHGNCELFSLSHRRAMQSAWLLFFFSLWSLFGFSDTVFPISSCLDLQVKWVVIFKITIYILQKGRSSPSYLSSLNMLSLLTRECQ